jgi:hypothetical protein
MESISRRHDNHISLSVSSSERECVFSRKTNTYSESLLEIEPAVDKLKDIHIVANQKDLTLNWQDRSGEKRSNYCHPDIKIQHYIQSPL